MFSECSGHLGSINSCLPITEVKGHSYSSELSCSINQHTDRKAVSSDTNLLRHLLNEPLLCPIHSHVTHPQVLYLLHSDAQVITINRSILGISKQLLLNLFLKKHFYTKTTFSINNFFQGCALIHLLACPSGEDYGFM